VKLPLSPSLIRAELESARDLLNDQLAKLDAGIPAVETPGSEHHLGEWLMEFTGELMLAARKCENVALTLAEPPGS